jgi:DNA-binding response OmpR family regulator
LLVVEDEFLIRVTAAEYLHEPGYQVLVAEDGSEAMTILRTPDQSVDLVFTDFQMPGQSGLDIAAWLHSNRPGTKVLITTGDPDTLKRNVANCGRDTLFECKPYKLAAVANRISSLLAR